MVKKFLNIFLIVLAFSGCKNEDKVEQEISKIPVDVEVDRFDQKFAKASGQDLPKLKEEYPFLFPSQYPDSVWVNKMNDTIQMEINQEVNQVFPTFEDEKEEIENLFQHFKYYFPEFKVPTVITITSDVDYKNKVVAVDSLLLISLDTYLGEDHKFYLGMQEYLKKNFRKEHITSDIVSEYGSQLVAPPKSRTLLAQMIYYGKILSLKDKLIPQETDAEKMGYTKKEMEWAKANEDQIWRYFIEREMLYDTDIDLQARFINLAPFTKFRLQLDNESPPQLGQYTGWQIVRQFVDKNEDVPLKELLQMDAETIFNKSNYKPRKP